MIRHLFQLIWNQKRKHLGLSFEIFFSFLVLFAVFSFLVFSFQRYVQPLGFEYEQVWHLDINVQGDSQQVVSATVKLLEQQMDSYPEVEAWALSRSNVPFSFSSNSWELKHEEQSLQADVFHVSDGYWETVAAKLVAGRFFGPEDDGAALPPAVLMARTARAFFGEEQAALGKKVRTGDDMNMQVVGVIQDLRYRGDFEEMRHGFLRRQQTGEWLNRFLVRVNGQADAAFEAKMLRDLSELAPGWTIEMDYLTDMRESKMLLTLIPLLLFGIISVFLIFNVALGLFGVLWQNISKRKEEIGIRRAIGSTRGEVMGQFMGEILVLTTFSILLGLVFAIQFPLLEVFQLPADVYFWGMLLAMGLMYLLVSLCSLFPSYQAAQLLPAVALQEE